MTSCDGQHRQIKHMKVRVSWSLMPARQHLRSVDNTASGTNSGMLPRPSGKQISVAVCKLVQPWCGEQSAVCNAVSMEQHIWRVLLFTGVELAVGYLEASPM